MKQTHTHNSLSSRGFSLTEVVVALGVVSFAIIAILGVFPLGLNTGHSAQDETRAPQIAQDILGSIVSQAKTQYPNATIAQAVTNFSYPVDLSGANTYTFAADNDGKLATPYAVTYPYKIDIKINPAPAGFDTGYASQVTVSITSRGPPPSTHDFSRIVSKY